MNRKGIVRLVVVVLLFEAVYLGLRPHEIHKALLSSTDDLLDSRLIQISQFFSLKIEVRLYVLIEIRLKIAKNGLLFLRLEESIKRYGFSVARRFHFYIILPFFRDITILFYSLGVGLGWLKVGK